MNNSIQTLENLSPLTFSAVAPEFYLKTRVGETVTRSSYRNKSGVIVLFFPAESTQDAQIRAYLDTLVNDRAEYLELNVKIVVILPVQPESLPEVSDPLIRYLADTDRAAWNAWTANAPAEYKYAAFMLDMYGGVDSQRVSGALTALPPPDVLLSWARGAQYRCTI